LLYRYWNGRDDLAGDVYRTHYAVLIDRLRKSAGMAAAPWSQVGAMLHEFLRFAEDSPTQLRFLLLSQHDLVSNIPNELGIRNLLRQVFEDGMRLGVIRRMPTAFAIHLALGVILQPVIGTIYGHIDGPVTKYADEILAALHRVLGADGDGVRAAACLTPDGEPRSCHDAQTA
jgi:hypothetical protein